MSTKFKQLNPFEIKAALTQLLGKIHSVRDIQNCLSDIDLLEAQEDKTIISKLLFKELLNCDNNERIPIICFLLEHFIEKDELVKNLWDLLQNKALKSETKITVLNLLREFDADWSFQNCEEYFDDANQILDASTKQLLNSAIINPEVQIDFMDFLKSIKVEDRITLINSLAQDFGEDELANILIPVFVSIPNSPEGRESLNLLSQTKSQLALHALEKMQNLTTGGLNQFIKKNLAILKMSGVRQDNTKDFYKQILSDSTPDKFYITYPDGHGDIAMICTRKTKDDRIRFISIVINNDRGIKDCFGFFDISQFECNKILERFLKDEKVASVPANAFMTILFNAEKITVENLNTSWELPYEYVCWKNLLIDIDYIEKPICEIVKENIKTIKLNDAIFEDLEKMRVNSHWFLDCNYSDEFEDLIKELKEEKDLNFLISKYKDIVFYSEEKDSWVNKLIISSYIKLVIDKKEDASELYSLSQNNEYMDKFYSKILKRSIYEYLVLIKYNKDFNEYNFTDEEISEKINYIEKQWVQNV